MTLRELERESIRAFVQSAADEGYLSGRVLDYGCGKQPYRDIVEATGGKYEGHDREHYPANVSGEDIGIDDIWRQSDSFDAILCTQVVQYVRGYRRTPDNVPVDGVLDFLIDLWDSIVRGGHLVLTYPTNWPEVEEADLHRFTKAGMERLLTEAGFTIVEHEPRVWVYATAAIIPIPGGKQGPIDDAGTAFALGYGVIARA